MPLFFFPSQTEALSGLRFKEDRPNIQEWGELGNKSRAMAVPSLPPVLARFMQRNPWRGDVEGKEHGDGWSKAENKRQLQSNAEMKKATEGQSWSKCQHTEEMVPLQSKKQKGHSGGDKAVPSLPSSYSSLPYLFQGGSRIPALV